MACLYIFKKYIIFIVILRLCPHAISGHLATLLPAQGVHHLPVRGVEGGAGGGASQNQDRRPLPTHVEGTPSLSRCLHGDSPNRTRQAESGGFPGRGNRELGLYNSK